MYKKILFVLIFSSTLIACGGDSNNPVVDNTPDTGTDPDSTPDSTNDPDMDVDVPANCVSIPRPIEGQDRTTIAESTILRALTGTLTSFNSSSRITTNRKITAVEDTFFTEAVNTNTQASTESTNTVTAANITVTTDQVNTNTTNQSYVNTWTFSIANNYINFTQSASNGEDEIHSVNTTSSSHPQAPNISITAEGESQTNGVTQFNPFHRSPVDIVCENQTWTDTFVAVSTGSGTGKYTGSGDATGRPTINSIGSLQGGNITIISEDPSSGTSEYTFTIDSDPVSISSIHTIEAINIAKTVQAGSFNTFLVKIEGSDIGGSTLHWVDIETNEIIYSESYDSSGTLIQTYELLSLQVN